MSQPTPNPFKTPRPRGVRWLQGALRVIVAAQCFGLAAARLHHQKTDLFCELLGKMRDLPADQVAHLSNIVAFALIGCGILTLLRPATFVLLPVILHQSATAFAPLLLQERSLDWLAPAFESTRSIVPLALLLVDFWPPKIKPSLVLCLGAITLLRFATSMTFLAQGLVCLEESLQSGPMVELLQRAADHGFHRQMDLIAARRGLALIGAVYFALAVALMAGRNRSILLSSILFALAAAFLPIFAHGSEGYSESLSRISEMGAPLAILLFQFTTIREQKPVYLAEKTADLQ